MTNETLIEKATTGSKSASSLSDFGYQGLFGHRGTDVAEALEYAGSLTEDKASMTTGVFVVCNTLINRLVEDGFLSLPESRETSVPTTDDELSDLYVQRGGNTCLNCGGDSLEGGSIQTDTGSAWQKVWCNDCGSEWSDNYNLVGTSDFHTKVPFRVGQEVHWTDPDADILSGVYTVKSIDSEDVVTITSKSGTEAEVPVSELAKVEHATPPPPAIPEVTEPEPGASEYLPGIVGTYLQDLKESGKVFTGETKLVDIKLAALTRQEYGETVLVPIEFGDSELEIIVDRAYDQIDGGEYCDDPDYWERGNCYQQANDGGGS